MPMFDKNSGDEEVKNNSSHEEAETIIGRGVKVGGNFVSKGNVVVKGTVTGNITTEKDLHLEEEAQILANIKAFNVIIAGEVKGDIKADERVELAHSARVSGDIDAKTMVIDEGAVLSGKCTIGEPFKEDKRNPKSKITKLSKKEDEDSNVD